MSDPSHAQADARPAAHEAAFPLTVPGLLIAAMAGLFMAVFTDNLLSGFGVFALPAAVAVTWRRGDPPVFPFIVTYQWVSITIGYWYTMLGGELSTPHAVGDLDRTVALSLAGLLVLAAGIRLAYQFTVDWIGRRRRPAAAAPDHEVRLGRLFVAVMAAYSLDYVFAVGSRGFGGFDSIVLRLLEFRQVLLAALWLEVLRQRKGYAFLILSAAFTLVPRLGAYYSEFKSPLVLMIIVLASAWRPWQASWWPRSSWAMLRLSPFLAALLVLLLVWQGGLKGETRQALDRGYISSDPLDRVAFFASNAIEDLPLLFEDPVPFVETLVSRLSYVALFSRVLDHVPDREPHAGGELLGMAMANAFMPRLLFPEKPELPSDSYYTRRFAGVQVADTQTSISIGYMAEFYADWGLNGMLVSVALYGCWIGIIAGILSRGVSVPMFRFGLVTVACLGVADFEHQFIKGFATLNLNLLVLFGTYLILRPWLMRLVGLPPDTRARQPLDRPAAIRPTG